jgi:hypothetical protein
VMSFDAEALGKYPGPPPPQDEHWSGQETSQRGLNVHVG